MKTIATPPTPARRHFDVRAVRWLLTLLLAFDLIGSPLHAHHHDLGVDGAGWHALHADDAADGLATAHVDDDPALAQSSGHSLRALLTVGPQVGPWLPILQSVVYGLDPAGGAPSRVLAGTAWNAAPDRIPIPHDLHLRPDGRAPPLLHS